MTAPLTVPAQPLAQLQWVPREDLIANDYNPNHVAPIELRLLRLSILTDGWTQPIVATPPLPDDPLPPWEIIDGFHRWQLSRDPEVWRLTDGLVPVVPLSPDPGGRRAATIRHNRARGTHQVLLMADIVAGLVDSGWSVQRLALELGMEGEEVRRLFERGRMVDRGSTGQLSEAWRPAER